ncbi:biogenesis of lysosome- organelles complex 1 subunit 2 [Coemansia nantahalensis]|uniref:Biogenesis of lysosome- organelles complex 1 subunit 2 n=2 Tax=Coemansia TaxID=4863 RepID=A0ACC1KTL3_9FUNG|nr:biogenesis of lysosome- organelles complex 1 subunit 2 [Coemansia nantahalensis]KAJ2764705.1 biogenesis of lysosome- organelles complex 1 subunit 2 [Coemansia nantahalensis]KAJ2795177.1 biogenesis of lysosome- organelles complex 1 subunit 2 [Coemansia helicoidea]
MSAGPGHSGTAPQSGRPPAESRTGPDAIDAASRRAFDSMARYLQAELGATASDLGLLEALNDASIEKYEGLSRQAQDMLAHAYKIKQTHIEMKAQIAEVDGLVKSIDSLEQVAQELDRYSLLLEAKFQQLLRRP